MTYVCHSGGCPGADMAWETEGRHYGVETITYSFHNHSHKSANPKVLTIQELAEGWEHVLVADRGLHRHVERLPYPYVRNLLSRNWFQVKNSEAVYAIGFLDANQKTVKGGTGWAVQMALDTNKPVHLFDQGEARWLRSEAGQFVVMPELPKLTEQFAGIGTRELDVMGLNAVIEVLKYNLGS